MRLIDVDAIPENEMNYPVWVCLKKQPTIDAVAVVRCKDCKHWKPIHEHVAHMECNIFCGAYEHGYPTNADDFCSYGKRKDGE